MLRGLPGDLVRQLALPVPASSVPLPLLLLLFTAGCWPFGGKNKDLDTGLGTCSQLLDVESSTIGSTGDTARLVFDVPFGTRSFLISVRSNTGGYVYISEFEDPNGDDPADVSSWYGQTTFLSSGLLPIGDEANFNWPVRDIDPAPQWGAWTVGVSGYDSSGYPQEGVDVDITVHLNQDHSTASGCLSVRVLMTPDVADDAELSAAVQDAVAIWQGIYASVGLELQPVFETAEGVDGNLPHPSLGSDTYLGLKETGDEEDLVLIVGESIEGTSNGILGEAGGIPGALTPVSRGVVAVGWLLHAGADGRMDDIDVQGMGETMAHELGHYIGLFHPVELDGYGNPSGYGDALDDTPACSTAADCTSALGTNLMFPYRTCYDANCVRQDQLTAQQGSVMQRYTGVR